MKIRIASALLAFGLLLSMVSVISANESAEPVEAESQETVETMEEGQPAAIFYLNGEPLYNVVAQCVGGTYYVSLASIMAYVDANAVVEETDGVATLTAQEIRVTDVAAEEVEAASAEGEEPAEEASAEEEVPAETEAAVAEVVDTLTLTAKVGDNYLVANGRYLYVPAGVIALEGQVAVPVRLLAEAVNMGVFYDPTTGRVYLLPDLAPGYLEDGETFYNSDSLYWLSRIIHSESGNQSMEGKIAVGNVVLNRVNNSSFPDTIYDVIFQKNQFSPAASGSIYRDPAESSVIAAKLVLDGAEVMGDALFFNRVGLKCYASKYRTFVATIGGHSFYA